MPWSALFSDPHTTVLGGAKHVVRLSARPVGGRPDLVFQLVRQDDFLTLLGLPQQLKNGPVVGPGATPSDTSSPDAPADAGSDTASPSS